MKTDRELKAAFRLEASANPEKYYPVSLLKGRGYSRRKCTECGKFFWSVAEREVCGDSACSGGYTFIGNSPAKKSFDYIESWNAFRDFFRKKGYYEYERYPVVARWRDDVYWVGASIYPFQPWVARGLSKPKSNAVIIPQLSLRFNDIDNVGVTGSHYVCFDMFGQLHFEEVSSYKPELYFEEYFEWITKGMGLPEEELVLHEDAWAGASFFGPCVEFFSGGCEIGNQVYMQFRDTGNGREELGIKVLDMGQGHERIPWFTQGKSTSYETTFPSVVKHLRSACSVDYDEKLMRSFLPYSAYLNVDEVKDIEKTWNFVAKKLETDPQELREKVLPLVGVYSLAEHSRAALVAAHDGALPSNVGGGYNLRVVIRRMFSFIDRYSWQVDLDRLMEMHASFLKPMYPELSEHLGDTAEIMESEWNKYREGRKRSMQIIANVLSKPVDSAKLIELYDSHGITPEQIAEEGKKKGIKVAVPDNFYAVVAERHSVLEQKAAEAAKPSVDVKGLPETEILYYGDWKKLDFSAKVIAVRDSFVILDRTGFYPTSGGQLHDTGVMNGVKITDAVRREGVVFHRVEKPSAFRAGTAVEVKIDGGRRRQLTQHHSSAHLINHCSREVLGPHVYQAGASKGPERARLDITHYALPSDKQLAAIEGCCNSLIKKALPVSKEILPREEAEEKYGTQIYQGGAVSGRNIRIVRVGNDIEACGGTHVNNTSEIARIKIINATKVQDGVIRINFAAGEASGKMLEKSSSLLEEAASLLAVDKEVVPKRAEELYKVWKKARKAARKGKKLSAAELELKQKEKTALSDNELLAYTAKILETQPDHVSNTIRRFLRELEENRRKLGG
jgi:alanyl-tRNA synthetase